MKATGWRKIATGLWSWPTDPQTYGRLEMDATRLQEAVATLRERTGAHITLTTLTARAAARAVAAHPQFNTRLVFGRFAPRSSVDVFVLVDGGDGKDLSGVKVRSADCCPVEAIANQVEREAADIRAGGGLVDVERGRHGWAGSPPGSCGRGCGSPPCSRRTSRSTCAAWACPERHSAA